MRTGLNDLANDDGDETPIGDPPDDDWGDDDEEDEEDEDDEEEENAPPDDAVQHPPMIRCIIQGLRRLRGYAGCPPRAIPHSGSQIIGF